MYSWGRGHKLANGEIHKGETFKDRTFGDGCLFENCTFIATCNFGKGCVFVNCTFMWAKRRAFSWVDEGASLHSCTLDWVTISSRAALYQPVIMTAEIGSECVINTTARRVQGKGTDISYNGALGEQVAGSEVAKHDWCSYKCKPGRYILGKAQSDVGVSGNDFGKEWSE